MQINFRSYGTWVCIITFLVGGLGAVTGLVSPGIASWITLIVTFLGGVLHSQQISNPNSATGAVK